MSTPQITLYAYPESPFAQKLSLVLLFKQLPYSVCVVPRMPPRSALRLLGINYRRIPVLAIGSDVYLDTSLATIALESLFPTHPLSGSPSSWGIQTASSFFWADRSLFKLAGGLLPWNKMGDDFIKDRSEYKGGKIDPEAMEKGRPAFLSAFRSHMAVVETQLAARTSATNFILDTPSPTYLDLSLYFIFSWVSQFGTADSLFANSHFHLLKSWMKLVTASIAATKLVAPSGGKPPRISAEDAAKEIWGCAPVESETRVDGAEPLLVSAGLKGWLEIGQEVEITPDDNGKVATRGRLVGLDAERVTIEVEGESGGSCRVHAPRLGFTVVGVPK